MKRRELYEQMKKMNQEEFDEALKTLREEEKQINESNSDEQSKRTMVSFRKQCEVLYHHRFNKKELTEEDYLRILGGKY